MKQIVLGIDACRAGWVVVRLEIYGRKLSVGLAEKLASLADIDFLDSLDSIELRGRSTKVLLKNPDSPTNLVSPVLIGIDMPTGLLDHARKGGRECEQEARAILEWPRSSSVFSSPVRDAMRESVYSEALRVNRESSPGGIGISKQAFHIMPRIRELDNFARSNRQLDFLEIHPELSFLKMAGRALLSKHHREGRAERISALKSHGFDLDFELVCRKLKGAKMDDLLDALAVSWSARRWATGKGERTGNEEVRRDSMGLTMEIHW